MNCVYCNKETPNMSMIDYVDGQVVIKEAPFAFCNDCIKDKQNGF